MRCRERPARRCDGCTVCCTGRDCSLGELRPEGHRDGVALGLRERQCRVVGQVHEHPRPASRLGMLRPSRHQVEMEMREPLGLGELHEVGLGASGRLFQRETQPAYEPTEQFTRVFDIGSRTVRYPEQASQQIWSDYPFDPFALSI